MPPLDTTYISVVLGLSMVYKPWFITIIGKIVVLLICKFLVLNNIKGHSKPLQLARIGDKKLARVKKCFTYNFLYKGPINPTAVRVPYYVIFGVQVISNLIMVLFGFRLIQCNNHFRQYPPQDTIAGTVFLKLAMQRPDCKTAKLVI